MKPGTFGSAPAAHKLVEIIEEISDIKEQLRVRRRIQQTLQRCAVGLRQIGKIPDLAIRKTVIILWRTHSMNALNNSHSDTLQKYPLVISYARNVVNGKVADALRKAV